MEDTHILMDFSHDLLAVIDFSGSFYHPHPDDIPTALLVNEILLEADVALYQAKQGGRNRVKRYTRGEIRP